MTADSSPPCLEDFESYLLLLARCQIGQAPAVRIDPQDAVQQTLARAHEKAEQFRGSKRSELAGWLRSILSNHLRDLFRRSGRELDEQAVAQRLEQSSVRLERLLENEQSTPSQRVAKNERLQLLADALMSLPDDQRRAIELRHLQGLTLAEIAAMMQRSQPSVGGLLQRGLRALREEMGH